MMKYTKFLLTILTCAAAMTSGCGNTGSENVKSGGISAQIEVKADGSGKTSVETTLNVGSSPFGTSLILSSGDVLKATANGTTQILSKSTGLLGEVSYITTFGFDTSNTEFVVSLERSQDTSCPDSRVILPEAFTITHPTSAQSFTRQGNVTVNWTPPSTSQGYIDISAHTSCTSAEGKEVTQIGLFSQADTGTATFSAASLLPEEPYDQTKSCHSEIKATRSKSGKLDPNYGEGGTIHGTQTRTVSIVIRN